MRVLELQHPVAQYARRPFLLSSIVGVLTILALCVLAGIGFAFLFSWTAPQFAAGTARLVIASLAADFCLKSLTRLVLRALGIAGGRG